MHRKCEINTLLANLFVQPEVNPQHARLKADSLERLHETYQALSEQNFEEYFSYLEDWTLQEADDRNLEVFVDKLRELRSYLEKTNRLELAAPLFKLCYYLLQQEGQKVRSRALQFTLEMMSTMHGQHYIKNTVKMLIMKSNSWYGYDSALRVFSHFRDRFCQEEYVAVLSNQNLYKGFRSKKVLSLNVLRMAEETISRALLLALVAVNDRLSTDSDEIIQTHALKGKVLLLGKELQMNETSPMVCFKQLLPYYERQEVRLKYALIEMTPSLVRIMPAEGVQMHYHYMQKNIKVEEPQISELVINNLRFIFHLVSLEDQQRLLEKLLSEKSDVELESTQLLYLETVAKNVIELLMHLEREELLMGFLNNFLMEQSDHVKLALLKSFFQHEGCKHLYRHFKPLLDQLLHNKRWRTRLESLGLLQRLMQLYELDQSTVDKLYQLIVMDQAYRVRVSAIKLVLPFLKHPMITEKLIPAILRQATNCNYKVRLTVLFFIQETFLQLRMTPLAPHLLKTIDDLSRDAVRNVVELAEAMQMEIKNKQLL